MTRQEIYHKIVRIADELEDIHFAERLFSAVENQDKQEFEKLVDFLKRYKSKADNQIVELGNTVNTLINTYNKCTIFSDKEKKDKGIYKFDVNLYDSLTLFIISILGKFEVGDLFENWGSSNSSFAFAEDIARYNRYLSSFVLNCNYAKFYKKYSSLYDLILDILMGQYT